MPQWVGDEYPGKTRSQWISSEQMITLWRRQISATFSNSFFGIDPSHGIVGIAEEKDLGSMDDRLSQNHRSRSHRCLPSRTNGGSSNSPSMHDRVVHKMEIDRRLNQDSHPRDGKRHGRPRFRPVTNPGRKTMSSSLISQS